MTTFDPAITPEQIAELTQDVITSANVGTIVIRGRDAEHRALIMRLSGVAQGLRERLTHIEDAIKTVAYDHKAVQFAGERGSLFSLVHELDELSNSVGDLISWHPEYDGDRGIIPNPDEEID